MFCNVAKRDSIQNAYIPLQVGGLLSHDFALQVKVLSPVRLYPRLQVNVAVLP